MSDLAPEVGPDGRQRPRYGEYASPEEQRSRIQQPDVTDALSAGIAPAPAPAPAIAPGPVAPAPVAARPPADRIITIVLLAMGAVNVVFSVPSFFDVGTAFARTFEAMGIPGDFTNTPSADMWGAIAGVLLLATYLITALAAWRRLRAGKLSWWIPVVGAVVAYVAIVICLSVPLASDPAFQEYIRSMGA
ncbi:hypothetical protein GCM10009775_34580 [Microbacterium aoyamense]|uniref:Uncharacterized protein n=1 Tax=Microbacterium aoyamense TaxID=344166 RepID=A0ABP5BBF7_9MICO|nr:DUF6264 family protein [Microbacterium aoyamense]